MACLLRCGCRLFAGIGPGRTGRTLAVRAAQPGRDKFETTMQRAKFRGEARRQGRPVRRPHPRPRRTGLRLRNCRRNRPCSERYARGWASGWVSVPRWYCWPGSRSFDWRAWRIRPGFRRSRKTRRLSSRKLPRLPRPLRQPTCAPVLAVQPPPAPAPAAAPPPAPATSAFDLSETRGDILYLPAPLRSDQRQTGGGEPGSGGLPRAGHQSLFRHAGIPGSAQDPHASVII